jgi:replicative DNA helicase
MIETMTAVVGEAYEPGTDAFDLLDRAEQEIFRISESQARKGSRARSRTW